MKIRTMALAMGGAFLLALGGVGAVACSSDDGTGTPATGTDASTAKDTGTTKADTGTVDQPDTGTVDQPDAGGPDCGRAAPVFHPVEAGTGPYCPFSSVTGSDAGNLTCATGEKCCEHAADAGVPSTCQAAACAATDTAWECQDPNNCGTGQVCCAKAASAGQDPGCSFFFLSKFTGTSCRTACATGELTVCESDGQCPSGQTCQNVTAKGGSFGFCK